MAERRRPAVRRQLPNQALRMGGNAQQDIFEVRIRGDVDQLAALHERIQERGATGAFKAARKQPVFPAEGDDAQLILGTIVIDREPTILDKALERRPLIRQVPARVAQGRFWQHSAGELVPLSRNFREQRPRLRARRASGSRSAAACST